MSETSRQPSRRLDLLQDSSIFAALPAEALARLSTAMHEETWTTGQVLLTEGEEGNCLHVVVEGALEVAVSGPGGPVPVTRLGPGDVCGEMALLSQERIRRATVTALTPGRSMVLSRQTFTALCGRFPDVADRTRSMAEISQTVNFLKLATPFAPLDGKALRHLATRIETREVVAGEDVVRQGEPGDACFVLREGRVEVLRTAEDGRVRRLSELHAGALLGEAALLTGAPRNATVRAVETSRLLVLQRSDLLEAMRTEGRVGTGVIELLRLRDRPRQRAGVLAFVRTTPEGEPITILKDPARGIYHRLSAQGAWLWEQLDGRHDLRDLVMGLLERFHVFAPAIALEVVEGLAAAGFIERETLQDDVTVMPGSARLLAVRRFAARALDWRVCVNGVDPVLERIYRGGVRLLFTPTAQRLLGLLATVGALAFGRSMLWRFPLPGPTHGDGPAIALGIGYTLAVLAHEAGHAFTVKAFGREVPRLGMGWYWVTPFLFVDTSDMWLADRGARIAVSFAGPYANILMAGAASLVATVTPGTAVAGALWHFGLVCYAMAALNFCPLLEYDGYHMLADLLDRPHLRRDAIALLQTPRNLIRHPRELGWFLACAGYFGALGATAWFFLSRSI